MLSTIFLIYDLRLYITAKSLNIKTMNVIREILGWRFCFQFW